MSSRWVRDHWPLVPQHHLLHALLWLQTKSSSSSLSLSFRPPFVRHATSIPWRPSSAAERLRQSMHEAPHASASSRISQQPAGTECTLLLYSRRPCWIQYLPCRLPPFQNSLPPSLISSLIYSVIIACVAINFMQQGLYDTMIVRWS